MAANNDDDLKRGRVPVGSRSERQCLRITVTSVNCIKFLQCRLGSLWLLASSH